MTLPVGQAVWTFDQQYCDAILHGIEAVRPQGPGIVMRLLGCVNDALDRANGYADTCWQMPHDVTLDALRDTYESWGRGDKQAVLQEIAGSLSRVHGQCAAWDSQLAEVDCMCEACRPSPVRCKRVPLPPLPRTYLE